MGVGDKDNDDVMIHKICLRCQEVPGKELLVLLGESGEAFPRREHTLPKEYTPAVRSWSGRKQVCVVRAGLRSPGMLAAGPSACLRGSGKVLGEGPLREEKHGIGESSRRSRTQWPPDAKS